MRVPLRFRIGRWLMRPYLGRLYWHYSNVADRHTLDDGRERCRYIAIGVQYAIGEPWNPIGFDKTIQRRSQA